MQPYQAEAIGFGVNGAGRLLAQDERARAAALPEPLRAGFLCSRMVLRLMIARHGANGAHRERFRTAAGGKPFLPGGPHFGLARSGAAALIGVSTHPLGVDLEVVRPIEIVDDWPRRYPLLARLAADCREEGIDETLLLNHAWVRLEALAKLDGTPLKTVLDARRWPSPPAAVRSFTMAGALVGALASRDSLEAAWLVLDRDAGGELTLRESRPGEVLPAG